MPGSEIENCESPVSHRAILPLCHPLTHLSLEAAFLSAAAVTACWTHRQPSTQAHRSSDGSYPLSFTPSTTSRSRHPDGASTLELLLVTLALCMSAILALIPSTHDRVQHYRGRPSLFITAFSIFLCLARASSIRRRAPARLDPDHLAGCARHSRLRTYPYAPLHAAW